MTRLRRNLLLFALGIGLAVAAAFAWAAWQFTATPDYWRVVTVDEAAAQQAARFEQWMASRFTAPRPEAETWQLQVDQLQVNRWCAVRLPQWAANRGRPLPDWLAHPLIVLEPGRVIAAARIEHPALDKVVSLVFEPVETGPDAVARLALTDVRLGSLSVPLDFAIDQLRDRLGLADAEVRRLQAMREHWSRIPLTAALGDGRTVDIVHLDLQSAQATLTCRTHATNPVE